MMERENAGKPKKEWKAAKGYKSALGKARDAAKAKAKKGKMAPFVSDDEDTASEGGFSNSDQHFHIDALRFLPVTQGTPWPMAQQNAQRISSINHVNSFSGLDDGVAECTLDNDTVAALNSWASNVSIAQNVSGKNRQNLSKGKLDRTARYIESNQKSDRVIVVKNARDANKLENQIASVPQSRKTLARTMKRVSRIRLDEHERLVMVDSGAFEHAIDCDKEIPESLGYVIHPPSEADLKKTAETACGGILKILGKFTLHGTVDGSNISVPFKHMKVQCPILSVRRLVRDGNEVHFDKSGGWIKNMQSGKKIRFFSFQGVYFMKVRITPQTSGIAEAGFGRPATA